MQTTTSTQTTKRDIGLDRNLRAIELTAERAEERYSAAVRRARFGGTPAIRQAAREEARQLRPLMDRYFPVGA